MGELIDLVYVGYAAGGEICKAVYDRVHPGDKVSTEFGIGVVKGVTTVSKENSVFLFLDEHEHLDTVKAIILEEKS